MKRISVKVTTVLKTPVQQQQGRPSLPGLIQISEYPNHAVHDFTRDLQVAPLSCRRLPWFDAEAEGTDSEPLQHLLWPMPSFAICKAPPLGPLIILKRPRLRWTGHLQWVL